MEEIRDYNNSKLRTNYLEHSHFVVTFPPQRKTNLNLTDTFKDVHTMDNKPIMLDKC